MPDLTPADEQAPVPPPVDATTVPYRCESLIDAHLKLVDDQATCCGTGVLTLSKMTKIQESARALWASGVDEGRRQQREEFSAASLKARGAESGIGARCVICTRLIREDEAFATVDGCGHRLCEEHQNDDHRCAVEHG